MRGDLRISRNIWMIISMEPCERLFVDSNYFIAYFSISDAQHNRALTTGKKIQTDRIRFVISNYIFLEVVTVLSLRAGRETARFAGNHLIASPSVEMLHIDPRLHNESWRLFQKVESKNISFVDCSTAVLMEYENIHTLLTFDTTDFKILQKHASFRFFTEA